MKTLKFRFWSDIRKEMEYHPQLKTNEDGTVVACCYDRQSDGYETMSGVLMQFTGYYDKKGIEIFEGDILQHESGLKTRVEFDTEEWCEDGFYTGVLLEFTSDQCTVIGNVYQNEELLK